MSISNLLSPCRAICRDFIGGALVAVLLAAAASGPAHAAIQFNIDYGNLTPSQRALVDAAIAKWESKLFAKDQKITLEFQFVGLSEANLPEGAEVLRAAPVAPEAGDTGTLGVTFDFDEKTTSVPGQPKPRFARIHINSKVTWWEGIQLPPDVTGDGVPDWPDPNMYDMYTVLKHEIGHAIGFTRNYTKFRKQIRGWSSEDPTVWVGKEIYDDGVNVVPLSHLGGTHTDERKFKDIMNPTLDRCTRQDEKSVSAPILARFWDPLSPNKNLTDQSDIGVSFACVTDALKNCSDVVFTTHEWHVLFKVTNVGQKRVGNWSYDIFLTRPGTPPLPVKQQQPGPPLEVGQTVTLNWTAPQTFQPPDKGPWLVDVVVRIKEPTNPDANPNNDRATVLFQVENPPVQISDIGIDFVCVTDATKICSGTAPTVFTNQPWHVLFTVRNKGDKPVSDWSFHLGVSRPGESIPVKVQEPGPPLAVGEEWTVNWIPTFQFDATQKGQWQLDMLIEVKDATNPEPPDRLGNNRATFPFVVENKPTQVSDIGVQFLCATDPLKNCTDLVFVGQPWHALFEVVNKGEKPVDNWSFDITLFGATPVPVKVQEPGPPLAVGQVVTINWPGPEFDPSAKGTTWQLQVEVTVKDPTNPEPPDRLGNNRAAVGFAVENKPLISDIGIESACVTRDDPLKECTQTLFTEQRWHILFGVVNKGEKPVDTWSFDILLSSPGVAPFPIKQQVSGQPLAVGEVVTINWLSPHIFTATQKGPWRVDVVVQVKDPTNPEPPDRQQNNRAVVPFEVVNKPLISDIGIEFACVTRDDPLKECIGTLFTEQRWHILFGVVNKGEKPVDSWSFDILLSRPGAVPIPLKQQVTGQPLGVGQMMTINWLSPHIFDSSEKGPWTVDVVVQVKDPTNPEPPDRQQNNRAVVPFEVVNKPPPVSDIGLASLCVTDENKVCRDTVLTKVPWHVLFEVVNKGEKPVDDWSFDIILQRPGATPIPIKQQIPGPPLQMGQVIRINWDPTLVFTSVDKGRWLVSVQVTVKDPSNPEPPDLQGNNRLTVEFIVENHPLTDVGDLPAGALYLRNAPNPFGGSTLIEFQMPRAGPATLEVYDLSGRLVRRLLDGDVAAGAHSLPWDGMDESGHRVPAGVYLGRLLAGPNLRTARMVRVD